MDYACGTGAVSRELSAHVKSIVGVDISQGVVDHFNKRVADQGIPPEEMRAVCAELRGTGDELDGTKFDVITCSVAYHHFPSIADTTRVLASFLKPGGSLLVVDFIKEEASADFTPTEFAHIVPHRGGFAESEMREAFEGAGLGEFSFALATKGKRHGGEVNFFLARGVGL
ncbi:hypothetical protein PHLGIDRAFT_19154 [Phlebiopsis gigantea 11061_1 CR5-6]|uniref:Methyltransferase domain-containing protein n=1 Tax=Phlebiopsis gigantea (strain 11061_1 CR5-6) TaxID=745531 RepID=A0A0C3RYZ7_PHLG1|nr:hypothetical protein PHLGIDRAFT_19154 [Phlebiopsis gigantea 11061_1 CR5-6]